MTSERFLTRPEAAALMRLNVRTLGNLAAMNPPQGPPYLKTARLRGKALYRESDVIAYMERNGRGQPATSSTGSDTTSSSARPKSPRRRKAASKTRVAQTFGENT